MTNVFKGLDLIEYLKNYGWRFVTLYRRQRSRPSPRKKMQKRKIAVKRREAKSKGEEERYKHLNAEFQRPFRYDLNQILYDYTAKVTNRFKSLDLIECLKNYRGRL